MNLINPRVKNIYVRIGLCRVYLFNTTFSKILAFVFIIWEQNKCPLNHINNTFPS